MRCGKPFIPTLNLDPTPLNSIHRNTSKPVPLSPKTCNPKALNQPDISTPKRLDPKPLFRPVLWLELFPSPRTRQGMTRPDTVVSSSFTVRPVPFLTHVSRHDRPLKSLFGPVFWLDPFHPFPASRTVHGTTRPETVVSSSFVVRPVPFFKHASMHDMPLKSLFRPVFG